MEARCNFNSCGSTNAEKHIYMRWQGQIVLKEGEKNLLINNIHIYEQITNINHNLQQKFQLAIDIHNLRLVLAWLIVIVYHKTTVSTTDILKI